MVIDCKTISAARREEIKKRAQELGFAPTLAVILALDDPASQVYVRNKRKACEEKAGKLKLPHFSAHSLRHTFCTRLCENEQNIKIIQEIMRHRNIKTTMDIYNEATKEKKMESFSHLDGKIKIV